ncbi:MAG: AhpC/TSA family protein [Polyangiaceae bacterium]
MPVLSEALGEVPIERALGWSESSPGRPTALVFVRHFACPTCTARAFELVERRGEIEALGAVVAIIGVGSLEALRAFSERSGLAGATRRAPGEAGVHALTDPSLACHRAAGLARSMSAAVGLRSIGRSLGLYVRGFWAARRADDGDVGQLAGVVVLDARGAVRLEHRARFVGDDLSMNDLIAIFLSERASAHEEWLV